MRNLESTEYGVIEKRLKNVQQGSQPRTERTPSKQMDEHASLCSEEKSNIVSLVWYFVQQFLLLPFIMLLCFVLILPRESHQYRRLLGCHNNPILARREAALAARAVDFGIVPANDDTEAMRAQRFDYVAQHFQYKYDGSGRTIPGSKSSEVTLDFEIEIWKARILMTPSLLLMRGRLNPLIGKQLNSSEVFPRLSKWFAIGIDGGASPGSSRKTMMSVPELQTVTASPLEFREGPIVSEVESWLDQVSACPKKEICHIGDGVLGAIRYRSTGDKLQAFAQYTVGISLSRVPKLLELTASVNKAVRVDLARAEKVCGLKARGCSNSYRGLLLLAARLISTANTVNDCHMNPKRYMKPWLVRTHFGDLARFGGARPDELQDLPNDALVVADVQPGALLWPEGIRDYVNFPDMAEIAGLVRARDARITHRRGLEQPANVPELANDTAGLEELAAKMINVSDCVEHFLAVRPCLPSGQLTAEYWLKEVTNGRDLMSDWDSSISALYSHSHLVWKSMGQWRMNPGDDRVYLECYKESVSCLPTNESMIFDYGNASASAMRGVARVLSDLV